MNAKHTNRYEAIREAFSTIQQSGMHGMADEWIDSSLTMAQVKAMFALQRLGTAPVGNLADKLRTGLPAASIIADKLVQTGMAERREDPQDRRRTLVGLSSRGKEHVLRLQQGRRDSLERLLVRLTEEDFAALLQGLQALAHVAQEQQVEKVGDPGVAAVTARHTSDGDV